MIENPGKIKVKKLLEDVDNGLFAIPYFQREFEWTPSLVCDLIESLLRDYYSGLLLLWEIKDNPNKKDKWDPLWGASIKKNPVHAILDGQQRLSSLYYALYNPNKKFPNRKTFYTFYVDLIKILNGEIENSVEYYYTKNHTPSQDIIKEKEDWIKNGLIPLAILSIKDPKNPTKEYLLSKEFELWAAKFIEKNKTKLDNEITTGDITRSLYQILEYNYICLSLRSDRNLSDICNIFARINEKGLKLSTFDLMNAFLYQIGEVSLRKDLWDKLDNESLKKVDTKMNEYLLKTISLVKQQNCSAKFLYNLIPGEKIIRKVNGVNRQVILVKDINEFIDLWNNSCKFSEKARKRIMNIGTNDFGAIKHSYIPNTTLLPVLAALLWKLGTNPGENFNKLLQNWYWSSIFSEEYSGSSDSIMAKDYRLWMKYIENNDVDDLKLELKQRRNLAIERISYLRSKSKSSAPYNGVLCLLALNKAIDFYSHRLAGSGDYTNSSINDHHIFPNKIKDEKILNDNNFNNFKHSIVNRTLLLDETNNKIDNCKPSKYIGDILNRNDDIEEILSIMDGHLISQKAFEYLQNDNFDEFIKEREKIIKNFIKLKLD